MFINELRSLIGSVPSEKGDFKRRMRRHQGWWRAFVLGEEPGKHPQKDELICNTIFNGNINRKNFLTRNTIIAVDETLKEWKDRNTGIIQEDRLFNNLLSSQPLCFNFFSKENYTEDQSAIDVAFDICSGRMRGLFGLECMYTDEFSYKPQKSEIFYGD